MKLHTKLTYTEIQGALARVKADGHVADDIEFVEFGVGNSRTHPVRFDIQLGTEDSTSGPTNSRHYKNSGQYGAARIYAATYDEWGWFIQRIFQLDPTATFGTYKSMADLDAVWPRRDSAT